MKIETFCYHVHVKRTTKIWNGLILSTSPIANNHVLILYFAHKVVVYVLYISTENFLELDVTNI